QQRNSKKPKYNDPWARREAWRSNPLFGIGKFHKKLLPGFGTAVVAFTAYVLAEKVLEAPQPEKKHH
ncbi:hypothetical protein WALSEDRAFT_49498, partial [Wallemia mellicola CBS 633.66]